MKTISKSLTIFILLLIARLLCHAQTNYRIHLNVSPVKAELRGITVNQDSTGDVFIRVNLDGEVKIGTSRQGTMEYWDAADGKHRKGKTKAIADLNIDYYDNFDADKTGKLKTFGDMTVDYYTRSDGFDNVGKVKSIGGVVIKYYDRFDADPELIGRIKSVGSDAITYYTKFDGFDNIGKLKSIGKTVITYFDRFSGREYLGRVKSVKGKTTNLYISQE
jgi:hypothetical protein